MKIIIQVKATEA